MWIFVIHHNTALITLLLRTTKSQKRIKTVILIKFCTRHNSPLGFTCIRNPLGFTCIPYIRGVSEQTKYVLCNAGVLTAYKPMPSLGDIFGKAEDKLADSEIKGIIYKFECPDCPFTEHKPGVRPEIKSAKIIEKRVQNTHKRLFLESLHSVLDKRSTNEHKHFHNLHAISAVMQR